MSYRGACPLQGERGSPWQPSDSEVHDGGEMVNDGADKRLLGLDVRSGRSGVLRRRSW
jgi:hypothetical protein